MSFDEQELERKKSTWLWLKIPIADLNGVLGNYATLGLNIADFSRYANKPSAQNVQAIVIPVIFSKFPPGVSHLSYC